MTKCKIYSYEVNGKGQQIHFAYERILLEGCMTTNSKIISYEANGKG